MGNFRIGQKVICINEIGWVSMETGLENKGPAFREILTIAYFSPKSGYLGFLKYSPGGLGPDSNEYSPEEFRPVDETFAENLIRMIEEEINEEQLILK